jgi:hypothetical protein
MTYRHPQGQQIACLVHRTSAHVVAAYFAAALQTVAGGENDGFSGALTRWGGWLLIDGEDDVFAGFGSAAEEGEQVGEVDPVGAQYPHTCGDLLLLEDLCGALVLVDQPAEDRSPAYPALLGKIDNGGRWARR